MLHLLVISGAAPVISGSSMTWATFSGGVIARNGVSGHGKYFIGIAAAAVSAVALSPVCGVWDGVRLVVVTAGAALLALAPLARRCGRGGTPPHAHGRRPRRVSRTRLAP
jgi:hypothetical protein